jgi:hypothetical protein
VSSSVSSTCRKVRDFIDLLAQRIQGHRRWMEPEAAAEGDPPE